MKGNAKKYLSLMLTASMVLGSFGTTAFAADTKAVEYISATDAYKNITANKGTTTTGASLSNATKVVVAGDNTIDVTNATIALADNHTILSPNSVKFTYTSTGATSGACIDITNTDVDFRVGTAGINVQMTGGTLANLTFTTSSSALRTASLAGASSTINVKDSTVKSITGVDTATIDNVTADSIEASGDITIKKGKINAVKSNTKVTVAENSYLDDSKINSIEAPEVNTFEGSKVTTITGENITVFGQADTITGKNIEVFGGADKIIVNDPISEVKVHGIGQKTKIEVAPNVVVKSLEITADEALTIEIPKETTKIYKEFTGTGNISGFEVKAEFYEKKSDTIPASESGRIVGEVQASGANARIKLPTTLNGAPFSGTWYSDIKDKDGNPVPTISTPAGGEFIIKNEYALLKFYTTDDSSITPTPEETKELTFEFYSSATTSGSALVKIQKNADDGKFYFPSYGDLEKYGAVFPEGNVEFIGWSVKGANPDVVYRGITGNAQIPNYSDITTYVAQFREDLENRILVNFTYNDGGSSNEVGRDNLLMYFADENAAVFPEYGTNIHPKAVTPEGKECIGWVYVTAQSNKPFEIGTKIEKRGHLVTFLPKFGDKATDPDPSETTKTVTYKDGTTTKTYATLFDSTTNKITLPTYEQVFGKAPSVNPEFKGWEVNGITYKESEKIDFTEGMVVTAKYGAELEPGQEELEIKFGNGTISFVIEPDTNGNIKLPTFEEVVGSINTIGKIFKGWRVTLKDTAREVKILQPGETVKFADIISIEALYEVVSENTIKVELYRISSDTTAQKTVELDYTLVNGNKVFKAPANEFSYSGKTFDSWSTNFDKAYYYPGKDITVPAGTAEPVKLYAYWTNKSSSGGGGGGGSSSSSTKYTVTASAGKGGSISPSGDVQVTKGNDKTFKITADEGYVISDVLVDGDSVGAVKSYTIKNIKNDMTIKAVFETESGEPAEDPENPSNNTDNNNNKGTFTDTRGHWAERYINTVVEKGLFSGMTDTTFGPDVAMTRAMFVTVLGRMSNVNTTSYSSSKFSDVPADSWFGPYVNWAAQQGIVSGLTSTTFGPNDPITREQMAVILVNYAKVAGVVLPTVNDPMMFSDNSNISGWAKDAVATAQKAGLINGRTNGSFDPQGKATRAEVATVFVQLDSLSGGSASTPE